MKHDVKRGGPRKATKSSTKGEKVSNLILGLDAAKSGAPYSSVQSQTSRSQGASGVQKVAHGPNSDICLENNTSVQHYQTVYNFTREILDKLGFKSIPSKELQDFIKALELDLTESQKGASESFMDHTLRNMAVFSVHNFCYTRALDILKEFDTRYYTIFKGLHEILNSYIRGYFESVINLDGLLKNVREETKTVEKDAIDHTSDILQKAELLLKENSRLEEEIGRKKSEWDSERAELRKTIKNLERENKDLFDKFILSSKGRQTLIKEKAVFGLEGSALMRNSKTSSSKLHLQSSPRAAEGRKEQLTGPSRAAGGQKPGLRTSNSVAKMQSVTGVVTSPQNPQKQLQQRAGDLKQPSTTKAVGRAQTQHEELAARGTHSPNKRTGSKQEPVAVRASVETVAYQGPQASANPGLSTSNPKLLTLLHLRSLIREIYASKSQHDEKCLSSGAALETLEQHLYTFMSTRFGLKSLVVEWVESVIQAVQLYAREDNEVAVFGKILQNEVDEEFRVVQTEVKKTLGELVKVQVREAFPKKGESWVAQEANKKLNGTVTRQETEQLLQAVLKTEDLVIVRNHLNAEYEDGKLVFRSLEKLILDFFLNKHEKYLSRVKDIFNSLDIDDDGRITPDKFKESLGFIDPMDELKLDANLLCLLADPHGTGSITFSKYIEVLSGIKVKGSKGEEISLIQFSKLM